MLDDGPVVLVMQRLALQRAAQHGVVPVWAGEPTTPVLAELGRFAACTADARPPPMSSRMRRAVLCIRTI